MTNVNHNTNTNQDYHHEDHSDTEVWLRLFEAVIVLSASPYDAARVATDLMSFVPRKNLRSTFSKMIADGPTQGPW